MKIPLFFCKNSPNFGPIFLSSRAWKPVSAPPPLPLPDSWLAAHMAYLTPHHIFLSWGLTAESFNFCNPSLSAASMSSWASQAQSFPQPVCERLSWLHHRSVPHVHTSTPAEPFLLLPYLYIKKKHGCARKLQYTTRLPQEIINLIIHMPPASVAQLDAPSDWRPGGRRFNPPTEVGNILSWRMIMKYFLRSFSPFRWFKKGSCQFLAKEHAQYWLTT